MPTSASSSAGTGGYSAEERLKLLHYVRDLTADTYGGWIAVTESLAGGGQYAQRLVTLRHYDLNEAKRLARRAVGHRRRDGRGVPSAGVGRGTEARR